MCETATFPEQLEAYMDALGLNATDAADGIAAATPSTIESGTRSFQSSTDSSETPAREPAVAAALNAAIAVSLVAGIFM